MDFLFAQEIPEVKDINLNKDGEIIMPGSKAIQAAVKYLMKKGKGKASDLIKPPKKPRKGARGDALPAGDVKTRADDELIKQLVEDWPIELFRPSVGSGTRKDIANRMIDAKNRSANYQRNRLAEAKAKGGYKPK
jgi:hypothetical protein